MARLSIALLLALSACGNGVVTTNAPPADDQNPNGLLPEWGVADAGGTVDAGPTYAVSGLVYVPYSVPAVGATVVLSQTGGAAQTTNTDGTGDYLFQAVPPGPFTVTATLPGYPPASLTGAVTDADVTLATLDLEASQPLFVPDAGFSPTWMAFAPDSGALYAADETSLWSVTWGANPGATALATDAGPVQPLGFTPYGTPVFFTDYQATDAGLPGHSGVLQFGAISARQPLGFFEPGPYLIGDAVYGVRSQSAATAGQPALQEWWSYSATAPNPTSPVAEAYAEPAAVATIFGLVGYQPAAVWAATCAQPFTTTGVTLPAICPGNWSWPTAIGVSPDGSLAAVEFSTAAEYGVVVTSWQVAVLSASGPTELAPNTSATQFTDLVSLSPLSPTSAAEVFNGGTLAIDSRGGPLTLTGSNATLLPDGSAVYLNADQLYHGSAAPLPFNGTWATPLLSPNGAQLVFPGVPQVIDVASWTAQPLQETPLIVQFNADGSVLLIVASDGSIHALELPVGSPLVDSRLEGTATVALLTPDGSSVIYGGQDPSGATGIFEQPVAAPPSSVVVPVPATDGGLAAADGGTP